MNDYFSETMRDNFKFSDTVCFIMQKVYEATEELIGSKHDTPCPTNELRFVCGEDTYVWDVRHQETIDEVMIKIKIRKLFVKLFMEEKGDILFDFEFYIKSKGVSSHSFTDIQVDKSSIKDKITKYRKQLSAIAYTAHRRHVSMTDDDIEDVMHNIHLRMSYQQAGVYAKEKITFDEFLKLGKDNINNNKTIYRFADYVLIVHIENHLRHKLGLECEHFDFATTVINQMFHIEDYDVHSITETDGDTFLDLIDKGYVVVDIDMKGGE